MEARTVGSEVKVEIWSDVVCPCCYIGKQPIYGRGVVTPVPGDTGDRALPIRAGVGARRR